MIRSFLASIIALCTFLAGSRAADNAAGPPRRASRDVTFISTSDSHYGHDADSNHNEWNRETVEQMNDIAGVKWPEKLGGDAVQRPRAVVMLGDCIDDGDRMIQLRNVTRDQYANFIKDFGFDGTDGLLKYPVFEGWGNHDGPPDGREKFGFSFQANLKKRNALRKQKGLISNLSANGLHYSWDWDDVHFVQLNIYPADKQREGVKYSPTWHDPQLSLSFLKEDLAKNVGASGRPVVLLSHCGFDSDWWVPVDWEEAYNAAKPYNVILYVYGHTATGLRQWSPAGEKNKWTCINDGQTTAGFFVIQIKGERLRAAYRTRAGNKITRNIDKTLTREWSGKWEWKHPLDKMIQAPAAGR